MSDTERSQSPESDIQREVFEAGNWLESELQKMGVDQETIETRCHLFGQLVGIMFMTGKKQSPREIAESYLAQFKKESK